ncbi:uncharacterized protein LOC127858793 isoform X2 [Dreissena polymorpha]|nr:uncharacterized protein LOC127858793 isoform X2 [Dreissena polymorpha]
MVHVRMDASLTFFGPFCEKACPTNCARKDFDTRCSNETGNCLYGCSGEFTGVDCMEDLKQESSEDVVPTAAIGGGVAAAVIVVVVTAVAVFIYLRRRSPLYDTVQRANNANLPEEITYAALQAKVCSTEMSARSPVCGETNAEYQNTDNEQHTYEIAS